MQKKFSLRHIMLASLIIIGGAFMFASSRSDSPTFTASISSDNLDQTEPLQEAESQEAPLAQPSAEETEPAKIVEDTTPEPPPAENTTVQAEQPKQASAPPVTDTQLLQQNSSEQSSVLTSIAVDPISVKPGESITITISTSGEIFSIIQIDAYLESPTGLNKINGAVVNVNADGKRFGSIPIPSGAEQGTWKIMKVETMDNTGAMTSYHYGTDIFTTFVVAP